MRMQGKYRIYIIIALFPLLVFTNRNAHTQVALEERNRLLGDWGGLRSIWEKNGLLVDLVYTAEYVENLNGGLKKGGDYRGDVSLFLELDTEEANWWDNGEFFAHLQEQHGEGITERYVGDFQVLSNIDADHYFQISELWYKHHFLEDKLWMKIGKLEANTDFAFVDFGSEFINSSAGFHPTIPLVTYPDQDWGVVLGIETNEHLSVNIGAFQGRPNGGRSVGHSIDKLYGPMLLLEPTIHFEWASMPGHLHIGYWHNGDEFERLDGSGSTDGTDGFYLSLDQTVYLENDEEEQGIGMFAQYASSDEDYIEAERYYGVGLQWAGALDFRDEDIAGLGVYHVELSKDGGFSKNSETVYELFYKIQVNAWCSVKPDVQYIVNPGGTKNKDATVFGVRTEIVF